MGKNPSSTLHFKYLSRFALIASGLLCLILVALNYAFPANEDGFKLKMQEFEKRKTSVEAITLGYSHMLGIDFDYLEMDGFHFYDDGGDYPGAILKASIIIPEMPNLKMVFMPLSEGSLARNNHFIKDGKTIKQDIIKNQPSALSVALFLDDPEVYVSHFFNVSLFKLTEISRWKDSLRKRSSRQLKEHLQETTTTEEPSFSTCHLHQSKLPWRDGVLGGYREIENTPKCVDFFARYNAGELRKAYFEIDQPLEKAKANIKALAEFAKELDEKGIQLVFVKTPVVPSFRRELATISHLDLFYQDPTLLEIAVLVNAEDLFDEPFSAGQNSYFYDGNHLSLNGARVFSQYLRQQLNNQKIETK